MRLFSKDKDFILRIINLIFLVWVVITLVICYDGTINLIVKKPTMTYSEYETSKCSKEACLEDKNSSTCSITPDETLDKSNCESMYATYKDALDKTNRDYKKQVIASLASTLTVVGTMYLLNKRKIENKGKQKKDK